MSLPFSAKAGISVGGIGLSIGLYSFFWIDPNSEMADRLVGFFLLLVVIFWFFWFWTFLFFVNKKSNNSDGADPKTKEADSVIKNFKKYRKK